MPDCYIYALSDPANPKLPRYIGKTTKTLIRRRCVHECHSREVRMASFPVNQWLLELERTGKRCVIYALEITTPELMKERETHWIRFFRPLGTLLNKSDGDGMKGLPGHASPLSRQRTIERNKRGLSTESRAKIWAHPNFQTTVAKFTAMGIAARKKVIGSNGEQFQSVKDAAIALGIGRSGVRRLSKTGQPRNGVVWSIENKESNV